jgi:UDP-glucuronate 4-epimerase
MSEILITGGAGFIGAHLAKRLLSAGYKVIIVDNLNDYYDPRLKKDRLKFFLKGLKFIFYKVDITDRKALEKIFKKHKIDIVCHLAAQPGVRHSLIDPWVYGTTNVQGTINLMEMAKDARVKKFILASSSSVYGEKAKIPFCESYKIDNPTSLYGATKMATELIGYAYHHLHGLKVVALRFFTVYGPWGRPDMAYFKFAELITKGKPIEIYNFGKMKRDFTYIDDIIDGIMAVIKKNFDYEVFNLGNNKTVELEKFIGLLENNLGIKAKRNYLGNNPTELTATWAKISKAKKMLGYSPKISIEQGLSRFVAWYKDYYKK